MKYFPLLWAALWRKKARTIFTLLSILVAFLLFGMLQGVNAGFNEAVERANVNRLITTSSIALTENLPYGDMTQIEALPGVAAVAHASWFGPYFQDPKNFVFSFPVEPERYYPTESVARLRGALASGMAGDREYSPAELRDLLGLTRKFLIPFLEYCDREGYTIRGGLGRPSLLPVRLPALQFPLRAESFYPFLFLTAHSILY